MPEPCNNCAFMLGGLSKVFVHFITDAPSYKVLEIAMLLWDLPQNWANGKAVFFLRTQFYLVETALLTIDRSVDQCYT